MARVQLAALKSSPVKVKRKLSMDSSRSTRSRAETHQRLAACETLSWALEPKEAFAGETCSDAAVQNAMAAADTRAPGANRERLERFSLPHADPHDPLEKFGVTAWLRTLSEEALQRYSQALPMQAGRAWKAFQRRLNGASELEIVQLLGALFRFAKTERSPGAALLFSAYVPLSLEHDAFGEYIGFETLGRLKYPRPGMLLVRRTLRRWCQWIESRSHWHAHQAMRLSNSDQNEVDKTLILLWPLAQRHQWNITELLHVLCMVSHRPARWFCKSQQDLISKLGSLGLELQRPKERIDNPPTGCSVALRYSQFWLSSTYNRVPVYS